MMPPQNVKRRQDTRDPENRTFRHFAKLAADGTVAAVIEVAVGMPDPSDAAGSAFVELTDLYPYDLSAVRVRRGQDVAAEVRAQARHGRQ